MFARVLEVVGLISNCKEPPELKKNKAYPLVQTLRGLGYQSPHCTITAPVRYLHNRGRESIGTHYTSVTVIQNNFLHEYIYTKIGQYIHKH